MPSNNTNDDFNTLFQQAIQLFQQSQPQKAKTACERICNTGIEKPEVWCLLSAINIQLGLNQQALQCAQRSIQISSEYADSFYHEGAALFNLGLTNEAIKALMTLIKLNPQHDQGQILLGTAYQYSGEFKQAIKCFQNLHEKYPDDTDINCRLADIYERTHRLEEAETLIKHALSFDPDHVELNIFAARIERRNKDYDAAYQRLCRIKEFPSTPHNREKMLNDLGLTCDKAGKYIEAFTAFKECNAVTTARNGNRYNYKTFINRIYRYKSAIDKEWKKYIPQSDEPIAPIFLIGIPRSGTTLTEQIITSHSSISASNELPTITTLTTELQTLCPGKVNNFPFGLENLDQDDIKILRAEYWKRVESHASHTLVGKRYLDKLPLNIVELGFILRIFPEAKIIFACRDPRDVCLSCFFQCFHSNNAMVAFENLHSTAELYAATLDLWTHYKNVLNFEFHESRYEDLTVNFEQNARELIKFIDEPWEDAILEYHGKNKRRNILTPSYQDISQPIYTGSVGRWKNYTAELQPILPVLAPYVKLLGYE